ncbi:MAG: hypothetical protein M3340_10725 [Actinomycetota bacterium]|nr:hypothetical protein [Actinomycetota bacterium]
MRIVTLDPSTAQPAEVERHLVDLAAGPLPNRSVQLHAVTSGGAIYTTWKETSAPDAAWVQPALGWAEGVTLSGIAMGVLPDGRLQGFAVERDNGAVRSFWKETTAANSGWTSANVFGPAPPPAATVSVSRLPDGRLLVWSIGRDGVLRTSMKQTSDPNSGWTAWQAFKAPNLGYPRHVMAAPLADGRLQAFALFDPFRSGSTTETKPELRFLASTWMETADPGSFRPWERWDTPELPVHHATADIRADGCLELFAATGPGRVYSRRKVTASANAPWTAWEPFAPTHPHVRVETRATRIGTARLSDGRLQVWLMAPGRAARTTWQVGGGPMWTWASSRTFTTRGWMGDQAEVLRQRPLSRVAMPGSHDAASSKTTSPDAIQGGWAPTAKWLSQAVRDFGYAAAVPWCACQADSIATQLAAGVRYFDLRVSERNHGGSAFWTSHALWSERLDVDVLDPVASFLRGHPWEVVLLSIRVIEWGDPSDDELRRLIAHVAERLPNMMIPPSATSDSALQGRTLGAIWTENAGREVRGGAIVAMDPTPRGWTPQDRVQNNIWSDRWFRWSHDARSANPINPAARMETIEKDLSQSDPDQFVLASCEGTPDQQYILANTLGGSTLKLARDQNPHILPWVTREAGPAFRPCGLNVVSTDDVARTDLAALCQAANDRPPPVALGWCGDRAGAPGQFAAFSYDGTRWAGATAFETRPWNNTPAAGPVVVRSSGRIAVVLWTDIAGNLYSADWPPGVRFDRVAARRQRVDWLTQRSFRPFVAAAFRDSVWVAFGDGFVHAFDVAKPGEDMVLPQTQDGWMPALAAYRDRLWIVFRRRTAPGRAYALYQCSSADGRTWTAPRLVGGSSPIATAHLNPGLAVHDDQLWLAWAVNAGDQVEIRVSATRDGSWSSGPRDLVVRRAYEMVAGGTDFAGPVIAATESSLLVASQTADRSVEVHSSRDGRVWRSETTFGEAKVRGPGLSLCVGNRG